MKISIVMPSYNQSLFVEAALQSVFSQDYENWEILFIDGGSTDGTIEIVEKYRERIAYCISEPDRGQSDALHKGFMKASGDVLTWLNTDDLLLPGALSGVAEAFNKKPSRQWVLGNVVWIDRHDRILKCWRGESFTPGWSRLGLLAAGGPSAFFSPELYHKVGGINLDLHYQMDTELWWRFVLAGARYQRLTGYTWGLRLHEDAKVSGAMFASPDDERQRKIHKRKIEESAHISSLKSGHLLPLPEFLRRPVSLVRRGLSPAYVGGVIDGWRFKGRKVNKLLLRK